MKFYLFLAYLLYGVTLLTFAVAASHYVGIALLRTQIRMPGGVRKQFRYLMLFGFISISLFLFFDKVVGVWSSSIHFAAQASKNDELIPRLVFQEDAIKQNQVSLPPLTPENSTTLYTGYSPTDASLQEQMAQLKGLGLTARFYTHLSQGYASEECTRWMKFLTDNGVKVDRSEQPLSRIFADKKTTLICLNEGFSDAELKALEQWVFDGGNVFLLGRPVQANQHSLTSLLGVGGFEASERAGQMTFVFGGTLLSSGTFGGNRITFGKEWDSAPGLGLAKLQDGTAGAFVVRDAEFTSLSPLVFSEYGKGRALWSSLPPRLYGKLEMIYGDLWTHLQSRMISFLFDLPVASLNFWRSKGVQSAALALHAEYRVDQVLKLISPLRELGAKASAYFVGSEAAEESKVVREWMNSGNEFGFSFPSHVSLTQSSPLEVEDAYHEMISRAPKGSYGLMVFPGVNASPNLLGLALKLGLRYVVGDPFSEQMVPYEFQTAPTQSLIPFYPDRNKTVSEPGTGSLWVLPNPLGDDFVWSKGTEGDIKNRLESIDSISRWVGAPSLYKIHSQNLRNDSYIDGLQRFMKEHAKTMQWQTVSALVTRANLLKKVSVVTLWKRDHSAVVKITNLSAESIPDLSLKISASRHWFAMDATRMDDQNLASRNLPYLELNISRLDSGETKMIPISFR